MADSAVYGRLFPDGMWYTGQDSLDPSKDYEKQVKSYLRKTDAEALKQIPEEATRPLFQALHKYDFNYEITFEVVDSKYANKRERELIKERGGYWPNSYNKNAPPQSNSTIRSKVVFMINLDGNEIHYENNRDLCHKADAKYRSFMHYRRKGDYTVAEALRKAQEAKQKKKKIWLYGEDKFDSIRKLQESPHNKHDVSFDNLSKRVSDLPNREKNEINGILEIKLPDSGRLNVLGEAKILGKKVVLQLPNGEKEEDSFENIIRKVREMKIRTIYGKKIPSRHTIHQRFREYGWSLEQAIEFEVPPRFSEAQKLMSEGYYYFGNPKEKLPAIATPLICHDYKIIWTSQKALAVYVGKHKTTIQDRIEQGHTPKEILDIYCKNPPPKGHKFLYQLPI